MSRRTQRLVTASAFFFIAAGSPAVAQEAEAAQQEPASSDAGLQDIVVTAQRRETRLQDTPIAISAYSGEDLRSRSLSDTSELNNITPSVSITPSAGNSSSPNTTAFYIRGIGQNDFIINSDPGVGIYVDGIYVARSTGSIFDLLDVERVEVLRGPQGTLFGKNATGGAVNITTRTPSETLTGNLEAIIGNYGRYEGRAYFSGPLASGVAAKLALSYKNRDGYGELLDLGTGRKTGELGGQKDFTVRGGILVKPAPGLQINIVGDYARNRDQALPSNFAFDNSSSQAVLGLYNALIGGPSGLVLGPLLNSPGSFDSYSTRRGFSNQDLGGVGATATWDTGRVTVKSITGYREISSAIGRDADGTPAEYIGSTYNLDQNQFSEELQLFGKSFDDRLDWLIGGYYLRENARELTYGFVAAGLYNVLEALPGQLGPNGPTIPCGPPFVSIGCRGNPANIGLDVAINYDYRQVTDSYAGFFQGTFKLTDTFSVTAGLRYTREDKELTANLVQRAFSGAVILPPGSKLATGSSAWTPKLGVEYKPSATALLYAYAARGFKSGGINGRFFDAAAFRAFDPEKVWTYEGGFKTDWLGRRLRVNGAIFYNDYKNIQVTVQDTTTGTVSVFITNAAAGRSYGGELDVTARMMASLDLGLSLAYLDTKYTESRSANLPVGTVFQKAPKWSVNLFAENSFALGSEFTVTPRVDFTYRSRYFNDPLRSVSIAEDGYFMLNARLTLASVRGWSLAGFATNLTDERYVVAGLDGRANGVGNVERLFGRPREYGLSLRYAF